MPSRCQAGAAPLFTVFTPTFNRADTLERLFRSLQRQHKKNFYWLIVDDGSTDGTRQLVETFKQVADFKISYFWQKNQGKYVAINRGAELAESLLIITIDSDDELLPEATEYFERGWHQMSDAEKEEFTGITARSVNQNGELVGEKQAAYTLDFDSATATFIADLRGERVGFHRVEVLRNHPFPEGLPTRFIPEGRVWLDIARGYKTRFVEMPLRVFHDHGGPRLSGLDRYHRAWGDYEYNRFALMHYASWWRRAPRETLKLAIGLRRAELHLDMTAQRDQMPRSARVLLRLATPPAGFLFASDLNNRLGRIGRAVAVSRLLFRWRGTPGIVHMVGSWARQGEMPAEIKYYVAGQETEADPRDPSNDRKIFAAKRFPKG